MSRLVDAAASLTSADDVKLQSILEQISVPDRWGVRWQGRREQAGSLQLLFDNFPDSLVPHIFPARQPWQ